jgi:protein-tyrosine phosphatase
MHEHAAAVLKSHGVETSGWRSQRLGAALISQSDLILTATAEHRSAVVSLETRAVGRTFPLLQFARLVDAARASEDLTRSSPAESGRELVAAAIASRGRLQPVADGADDVDDPIGRSQALFDRCGAILFAAAERILPLAASASAQPYAGGSGAGERPA